MKGNVILNSVSSGSNPVGPEGGGSMSGNNTNFESTQFVYNFVTMNYIPIPLDLMCKL